MAQRDLTRGPVWRALALVSAPMSFGILAVLSVGLADAYFLGQLGQAPLAAVGFIYPVTTAITSMAIGLSAGANAAVSQAIGRGEGDAPTRLALHSVGLGATLAILIALAFLVTAPTLFRWMGAGEGALTEAKGYVPFWALSFPFLVLMMVVNAVFRAHGDGATSAAIMVLAAVINIAINPLLIFGWGPIPGMGTEGAALATAIGRSIGALAAVGYAWHCGILTVCSEPFKDVLGSVRTVLTVGVPAALSNGINPAGMALVTAAVATLGEAAVAGFGAATRVQSVALVALFALSSGIGPVVGQNWGAEKQDRAREAVLTSWIFCGLYGLVLSVIALIFADSIAGLFIDEGEARGYAASYLQIVSWSFFGYGVVVTTNAAMNARSKAFHSMALSLTRIFAVYVPLAWLGLWLADYWGILLAAVAANLAGVLGAVIATWHTGLFRPADTRQLAAKF